MPNYSLSVAAKLTKELSGIAQITSGFGDDFPQIFWGRTFTISAKLGKLAIIRNQTQFFSTFWGAIGSWFCTPVFTDYVILPPGMCNCVIVYAAGRCSPNPTHLLLPCS